MPDQKEEKGPVTVLELALFRGAKEEKDGSITMGAIEATGLPFMGGCGVCGACVTAYNAAPTTKGFIACANSCARDIGYASPQEANRALFPEEYEWQGAGHRSADFRSCDGTCDPVCKTCRDAADIAAQNEILENGY